MSRFGTHIKQQRQDLGLSQAEVAQRAGITPAGYANIERGIRTTSAPTARAICAALNLGPPWPAVAGIEHLAAEEARARGITLAEAYDEHMRDMKRALAEFEAGHS
jgi:transcriptional regulator with XRE-family HTH domain